jgi:hypothetical protein
VNVVHHASHRRKLASLVLVLALSTLATAFGGPALADADDSPQTGPWAEDGSVFLDTVRLSSDDPEADPVDWYRVNLSEGPTEVDLLRIDVNMTQNGAAQLFVWASIHDPDGALVTEVKATSYAVRSTSTVCHRTGVYLVRVYTYSRFDCHYRLAFNVSRTANVSDGDDTLERATFIKPPTEVTGHLHGIRDTFDHYAVNLTRDVLFYEFIEVRLRPNGTSIGETDLDLFLIVLDEVGVPHEVAASTSNGSTEVVFYAATVENLTVYIRCHAYGGITGYTLNVTLYRVSDDGNNNIGRAIAMDNGASRNDSLNITDRVDFFKVNLTGGDLLWVSVAAKDYDPGIRKPDLNLYLYSPDERIINWSHSYDPEERIVLEVPMGDPPADYFVLVTFFDRTPSDGHPAWGNYTLNITIDHAPRLLPDLPLLMEEDDTLRMPLASLVEDPEDELRSVTPLSSDALGADIDGGDVVISPAANLTGLVDLNLLARDGHRVVTLVVPIIITPLPDPPALADPSGVFEVAEDASLDLNLSRIVVDGDGDLLEFALNIPPDHMERSHMDGRNLTAVPDADYFGDGTLELVVDDGSGENVTLTLTFSVLPLPDPPRVLWAHPNLTAEEDQGAIDIDLLEIFGDPDGEPLTYVASPGDQVSHIILGDTLVVETGQDAFGVLTIDVEAKDGEGGTASVVVEITVQPVNDPPRVTSSQPDGVVSMPEGNATTFVITAIDVEGSPLSYSWHLDGEVVDGEVLPRYELVTGHASSGTHLVSVIISDGSEDTWFNWTVVVSNVNRPPTLVVKRPSDGDGFEEGTNVVFEAEVGDPDDEPLSVQWFVDDEEVGTGTVFTISSLDVGRHVLKVRVTDTSGSYTEADLEFEIEEESGIPGECGPLSVLSLGISALAATAWHRRRRS